MDSVITDEMRALIGTATATRVANEPIGSDSLRRFVQATMESNPVHWDEEAAHETRFGAVVAPPLYPFHAFKRPAGSPDPLDRFAEDPDWDGSSISTNSAEARKLPSLNLPFQRHLNGGSEIEFYSMAHVGDVITEEMSYADIIEKESSKGPMVLVVVQTEYRNQNGEVLLRARRTGINR